MTIVDDFDAQAVANIMWSLTFLEYLPSPLWVALMKPFGDALLGIRGSTNPENLRQIFQVKLLLECDGKWGPQFTAPHDMLTIAEQAWKEQATNIVISKLHNDVSSCLHSMQIAHQNEYLTDDQLFSIDVAMQGRVPPIALEVDGPFHFTANTHLPLGSTICRKKLLEARGWRVISVPYFKWAALESGEPQQRYLAGLLNAPPAP